ncbi:MAG: DUF2938 domain-containing protein [Proteobacteria bacterium]|nr:DUF2938 domain-containing protein [Pseudomonadota bacterium]
MNALAENLLRIALIGVGATLIMDGWLMLLKRLHVPTLNFGYIGRWVGHIFRGRWFHDGIVKAAPIKHELLIGWLLHYATGLVFAMLLVAIWGAEWLQQPRFMPALLTGVATVVVPLFVMQPAMGAGIASSRTPTPTRNCIKSVLNHAVFGYGLYLAGVVLAQFA